MEKENKHLYGLGQGRKESQDQFSLDVVFICVLLLFSIAFVMAAINVLIN